MSELLVLVLINLAVLMTAIMGLWLYAVKIRDVSFIDAFWGFGMVILAWASWVQIGDGGRRATVLLALTSLWGVRLALHLLTRWRREGEDPRYAKILGHAMERKGWSWAKTALLSVFLTQAPLLFITALPAQLGMWASEGSGAIMGPMLGGYLMAAKVSLPVLFASYCVPLLACAACVWTVHRLTSGAQPEQIDRD